MWPSTFERLRQWCSAWVPVSAVENRMHRGKVMLPQGLAHVPGSCHHRICLGRWREPFPEEARLVADVSRSGTKRRKGTTLNAMDAGHHDWGGRVLRNLPQMEDMT